MARPRQLRILKAWVQAALVLSVAALLWPSTLGGRVGYVMVSGESMQPGLHTGDLVLVRHEGSYSPGDAIAYRIPDGQVGEDAVVIHRVVGGNGDDGYVTQGDNRDAADDWHPTDADVLGSRWVLVPRAGTLVAALRAPLPLAVLAAVISFAVLAAPSKKPQPVTP
jgi:signal peptidase I